MRSPKTRTIFLLAAALFFLAAITSTTFYPAPIPVHNSDGTPRLKPDGKPVVYRDMNKFWRYNAPSYIFEASSVGFFVWWVIRIVRMRYGHALDQTKTGQ
jgi:hypothetical protein